MDHKLRLRRELGTGYLGGCDCDAVTEGSRESFPLPPMSPWKIRMPRCRQHGGVASGCTIGHVDEVSQVDTVCITKRIRCTVDPGAVDTVGTE